MSLMGWAIAYAGLSLAGLIVVGCLITILWPYRTMPDQHPDTRPLPQHGATVARARVPQPRSRPPYTPRHGK